MEKPLNRATMPCPPRATREADLNHSSSKLAGSAGAEECGVPGGCPDGPRDMVPELCTLHASPVSMEPLSAAESSNTLACKALPCLMLSQTLLFSARRHTSEMQPSGRPTQRQAYIRGAQTTCQAPCAAQRL